jgi:hypothetical protein
LLDKWVDPDYPENPIAKFLVLALWEDASSRRMWEEALAHALEEKNDVTATPSYRVLESVMPDSVAIFDAARREGCDGVVVAYELYDASRIVYVAPYVETGVLPPPRWCLHYGRCGPTYYEIYHPGHDEIEAAVRCDIQVWSSVADVRIVWSGTTEVIKPDEGPRTCDIVASWVEYEMIMSGLIDTDL